MIQHFSLTKQFVKSELRCQVLAFHQHYSPRRPHGFRVISSWSNPSQYLVDHQKAVEGISAAVKGFHNRGETFRIFHGSTNSTRPRAHTHTNVVDTSRLGNVLHVDPTQQTALVEPNVPMDRLVEATLRHGLVPPVVMEFPGITVGGGYAGTSGESSSFKHGFFDQTIKSVEMVLADGEVVKCSPFEKTDLFHGAAGALGTLGITTLVELQLRQAKKFVETTYHPVSSIPEAVKTIKRMSSDPDIDYIDGIVFSKAQGAIITGRMTNDRNPSYPLRTFSNARDPWYYLHVQSQISQQPAQTTTETIPLAEYLFRYDRGGFWVGASAFSYFSFPFNAFTRWFLDDFLHTRMMYTALHASGQSKTYIVQDLALPYDTAAEFMDYTHDQFGIYPLWLCPLRQSPQPTMHPHLRDKDIRRDSVPAESLPHQQQMLNIGLWGPAPPGSTVSSVVGMNQSLEHKLRSLRGMKWLYAHTYYSEPDFWAQFDREWYDRLRTKYGATGLPSVYEKVKVDVDRMQQQGNEMSWNTKWPWAGFYGIRKAIQSKTYLAARKAEWRWKG